MMETLKLRAGDPAPPWWVIHTLPRCEKKMAAWLARHALAHYLPLHKSVKVYPGKKAVFYKPLFPGYAFGAFPPPEKRKILQSRLAASVIPVGDQERFLGQLENVRRILASDAPLETCSYLTAGTRVRITSGKLRGLEGFVVRLQGKTRLILSVDMLQRSVAVEVDPLMVAPCA